MNVRFGTLLNVYGTPVEGDGYTLLPADVELAGSAFSFACPLSDHPGVLVPPVLRFPITQRIDAAWVRARLPRVFGFTPDPAETEKALLYAGFVAVTPDGVECYPFVCTDHYGQSALMFNDHGPEARIKQSLAAAFWGTLVRHPDDLADFEERVYHPGAGVWLTYGCQSGLVYCDESE